MMDETREVLLVGGPRDGHCYRYNPVYALATHEPAHAGEVLEGRYVRRKYAWGGVALELFVWDADMPEEGDDE